MTGITRRELLGATTAIGVLAVSGCLSRGQEELERSPETTDGSVDPDVDGPADTDTPGDGEDTGSADAVDPADVTTPSGIDDASIRTTGTDCATPGDDRATVDATGPTVVVEGTLPAPTPCYEAVLESMTLDGGVLSVTIDVANAIDEEEGCVMCQGAVSYRATVVPTDSSDIESVTVDHATGDRHAPGTDTPTPGDSPGIDASSIETVDAGCRSDDGGITVGFDEEVITVTGTLPAPNPCHEAVLDSLTVEDARLRVAVDVSSTLEDGTGCVECVGAITYDARIEPEDTSAITAVTVVHASGDDTTVTR
jgi:hypothetical protein